MNRRKFLAGSSALAATGLLSQLPGSSFAGGFFKGGILPIGYQSYVLRKELNDDFVGTLKKTAAMGYQHLEMCSPKGYAPDSFGNLVKYSGAELKKIINDAGLQCWSCHFQWNELNENLDERIAFAKDLGLKHMVASGGLSGLKTEDEIKSRCEALNAIGEKIKKAGLVAGYHNHNGEFQGKKNGRPDYDLILEQLNPDSVKMQFQVAVIQDGYKAQDYFRKFPGRFISAHLQDFSKTDKEKQVTLGDGIVDWKDFFDAAKTGGLKWVYFENESAPESMDASAKFLKSVQA